jgi:hypothetical protein
LFPGIFENEASTHLFESASQALSDLKRRAKLREIRKRYGNEYLLLGVQHPEVQAIYQQFSMQTQVSHRQKVEARRDIGFTNEASIEQALERTQGGLNPAAELLMGST